MPSTHLLDILVCPVCHGELLAEQEGRRLCCLPCGLAFPVREGIPVMLPDEAERIPTHGPHGTAR